jgi:hypothetical protein
VGRNDGEVSKTKQHEKIINKKKLKRGKEKFFF